MGNVAVEPGDVTIESYQSAADVYRAAEGSHLPAVTGFLVSVAERVGKGRLLELGSGTGRDAAYLEDLEVAVVRTDATPAFVEMLRATGHDARLLDARRDDLGSPYDGVLAMAMLLHLTRAEVLELFVKARRAVRPGGVLAFTVKEGDGDGWSEAKLGRPRYFVYWREHELRAVLVTAGWTPVSVEHVSGSQEPWLFVIAEPAASRSG